MRRKKNKRSEAVLRKHFLEKWQPLNPFGRLWKNYTGHVMTMDSRRIKVGIPPPKGKGEGAGGSDQLGWETIEITPEMVGEKIAIFTAKELKTYGDRLKDNQADFLTLVYKNGGRASIVWEREDGQWDEVNWNPNMKYLK